MRHRLVALGLVGMLAATACGNGDAGTERVVEPVATDAPTPSMQRSDVSLPDAVDALVAQGAERDQAVLTVLEDQLSNGIRGELTSVVAEARGIVMSDGPAADDLRALLEGWLPSVRQLDQAVAFASEPVPVAMSADVPVAPSPADPATCRELWSQGDSDLFSSASTTTALGCLRLRTTEADPRLRSWKPEGFDSPAFEQWAHDAVVQAVTHVRQLRPEMWPIEVLYDPRTTGDTLAWAMPGLDEDVCYVVVPADMDGFAEANYRFVIEHEVAHCFQFANLPDQSFRSDADWWLEAGAELLAVFEHGTAEAWHHSPIDQDVFDQDYDNWMLWGALSGSDAEMAVKLWEGLPASPAGDRAWLAGRAGDLGDMFHRFFEDGRDGLLPLGVPYELRDSQRADVTVSTDTDAEVDLPGGSAALLSLTTSDVGIDGGPASIRVSVDVGDGGLASWWDGSVYHSVDDPIELFCGAAADKLLISAMADTTLTLRAESIPEEEAGNCNACTLFGPRLEVFRVSFEGTYDEATTGNEPGHLCEWYGRFASAAIPGSCMPTGLRGVHDPRVQLGLAYAAETAGDLEIAAGMSTSTPFIWPGVEPGSAELDGDRLLNGDHTAVFDYMTEVAAAYVAAQQEGYAGTENPPEFTIERAGLSPLAPGGPDGLAVTVIGRSNPATWYEYRYDGSNGIGATVEPYGDPSLDLEGVSWNREVRSVFMFPATVTSPQYGEFTVVLVAGAAGEVGIAVDGFEPFVACPALGRFVPSEEGESRVDEAPVAIRGIPLFDAQEHRVREILSTVQLRVEEYDHTGSDDS